MEFMGSDISALGKLLEGSEAKVRAPRIGRLVTRPHTHHHPPASVAANCRMTTSRHLDPRPR